MTLKAVRFEIAPEVLCQTMELPEGARVLNISYDPQRGDRSIYVIVTHDDLPEVQEATTTAPSIGFPVS